MHRQIIRLLAGLVLVLGGCVSEPPVRHVGVTVVVNKPAAVGPPTRETPAYYWPLIAGYREEGAIVRGENPPNTGRLLDQLRAALAAQNYLAASLPAHPPSMILVFNWGYRNPVSANVDGPLTLGTAPPPPAYPVNFNSDEMLALVAGGTLDRSTGAVIQQDLEAARDDRYFLIVVAMDYAALKRHEKKLLWVARMSVPSTSISADEAMPALIAAGAPLFGRETPRPDLTRFDISTPQGTVIVKQAVVVPSGSDHP